MTEAGWRLIEPDGMDDLGWFEVASKGVLMGGRLAHGDRTFPVIVVDDLTRESAEAAVIRLGAAGQFDWLLG